MSDVFPTTPDDERDPREDQKEDKKREEEIKGDKPPHHGQLLSVVAAGFATESVLQKPDPLKTTPTAEYTLRISPLHSGHSVSGDSENDWKASKAWSHETHAY